MAGRENLAAVVILAAAVSLVAAILWTPSSTPLSPWNTGPQGASGIPSITVRSLREIPCGSRIVIALAKPPTQGMVRGITSLASCNSTIVLLDSRGYSSSILSALGIEARVENVSVLDEVSGHGIPWLLNETFKLNALGINASARLLVPHPKLLSVATHTILTVETSPYAYADLDGNGYLSSSDRIGRYPVLAAWRIQGSLVILIPSLEVAYNNYSEGLAGLLSALPGNTTYYYTGSLNLGPIDKLKAGLSGLSHSLPGGLAASLTALAAIALAGLYLQSTGSPEDPLPLILMAGFIGVLGLAKGYLGIAALGLSAIPFMLARRLRGVAAGMAVAAGVSLAGLGGVAGSGVIYSLASLAAAQKRWRGRRAWILGPTSYGALSLQAYLAPLILLDPHLAAPLSEAIIFSLIAALASYILTGTFRVEIVEPPGEAPLGGIIEPRFKMEGPIEAVLLVDGPEGGKAYRLRPGEEAAYPIKLEHAGLHRLRLRLHVLDPVGLSIRHITDATITVIARPVIGVLRDKLRRLGIDVERLVGEARILLAHLEGGTISAAGGPITTPGPGGRPGGMTGRGGGGVGEPAAAGGLGPGKLGGLTPAWLARGLLEAVVGVVEREERPGGRGEYTGPRPYVAGDRVTDIHWKKSIEKQTLIVKEWAGGPGGLGGGGGGRGPGVVDIVIANLEASRPEDLDRVVYTALELLETAREDGGREIVLALVRGSDLVVLGGSADALLAVMTKALEEWRVSTPYNYRSHHRSPKALEALARSAESRGPHAVITAYNASRASRLVARLGEAGVRPPAHFIIVHAPPASVWASITSRTLRLAGYRQAALTGSPGVLGVGW